MARARIRILVGLGAFFGAAAVGFHFTPSLTSESLRVEAEQRLTEVIGSPVRIGRARVALGLGLRLEGSDVVTWTDADGDSALQVDRIRADIRLLPLAFGELRFSRVALDGARLRVERGADGAFSPEPFAGLGPEPDAGPGAPPSQPDELVSPLIRAERLFRGLLGKPAFADRLDLRNGTIVFIDARVRSRLAPPVVLALESVRADYRHSRFTRVNRLTVRARVVDARGERGTVEWEGTGDRDGGIRVALATTDLQLDAFAPYVRARHPDARVEGDLSGAVVLDTKTPGHGRLEVDVVGHHFRTVEPRENASTVAAQRVAAVGTLEITPQNVRLVGARLRGGELSLELDGTIARPLRSDSFAQVALAFRDVEVAEVRHLIGWLPDVEREEAEKVVEVVKSGRLRTLRAGGAATISAWQEFLAGRTRTPPAEFFLDATLDDTVVTVGEDDRLEDLEGRLWWSGNRAEVQGVRAKLNGTPLPVLDVVVEDVTNFLAGDPERRRLRSGGVPLLGMRTLWEWFRPDPADPDPAKIRMALGLQIETLHHPMFLWPIENASAAIWDVENGLHIVTDGGTWAGVPISGEADWMFEPEERVRVSVSASPPDDAPPPVQASRGWAEGTLVIGLRQDGPWRQQHATSRFTARGGTLRFDDVEIPLRDRGNLDATIEVEVGTPHVVPFDLHFAVRDGSVEALASQLGRFSEMGSGTVDLAGSFRGALRPGKPFVDGLTGLLDVDARKGSIRRSIPAVVAVALASESYNPFARRKEVRYDRCRTVLEFSDGVMSTDAFSMDGPDLRVFASGSVDLVKPPNEIHAQVGLFLFRQIDKILGAIPVVNLLLLGTNENLVGAHFTLSGPWDDPEATAAPLGALAAGPASIVEQGPTSLVLQTIPMFMMRGIEAIESMLGMGPKSSKQAVKRDAESEPSES